jgi:hypothetical protein
MYMKVHIFSMMFHHFHHFPRARANMASWREWPEARHKKGRTWRWWIVAKTKRIYRNLCDSYVIYWTFSDVYVILWDFRTDVLVTTKNSWDWNDGFLSTWLISRQTKNIGWYCLFRPSAIDDAKTWYPSTIIFFNRHEGSRKLPKTIKNQIPTSKTIKNHQKPCNSSIFCASIGAPSNHVKSLGTDGKTCKFSGQKKYRLKTLNSLGYGHNFMGQQMILNSYVVFLVNLNPKKE